jgi:TonB-linked SusC/RagA family outer membrane protein
MIPWRRRAVLAIAGAVAIATTVHAQQPTGPVGTVIGQVVVADGRVPLQAAQVLVIGTTLRAGSGADGRYVIRNVPVGAQTVRVQILGFSPQQKPVTVTAGGTSTVDFDVKEVPYAVAPMITTALGLAREEKSLGYATTSISSATLERIPETTMMQALAGQSAGVQVTSASGRPGASGRVVIRGENSFAGNTQPLFVIDGVPVSTATDGRTDALGTGSAGSRQMDLDMDSIEELTVLRGAAATGLYGSRAASGAIIIKTKRGRTGQALHFGYNTEFRLDRPLLGGYVTDWAGGNRGYFCNGRTIDQGGWCEPGSPSNPDTRNNWGPHRDSIPQIVFDSVGDVRFRDARADFYRRAPTLSNSLDASGAISSFGNYRLAGSYLRQRGVNPMAQLNRLNLNANIGLDLSKWLKASTGIQRIHTSNPYSDDSFSGLDHALIDMPPTTDIRDAWNPDGTPRFLFGNTPHFEWVAENETNSDVTNRWIVSQQFDAMIVSGVHLMNNWGLDTYVTESNRFINQRPWLAAVGTTSGSTRQAKTTFTSINNDLILAVDKRMIGQTGVGVSGLVGGNLLMSDRASVTGTGTSIVIPDYFNLSNFATQTVSGNLPTKRRVLGAYSEVTADYNDWAFLRVTGRNDWSSTLPTNANSYFYPSASLSLVFTDALNWHPRRLDYGKLRLSRSKVGNDAPAYSLTTRYIVAGAKGASNDQQQNGGPAISFPFRGVTAYNQSTQLGNPELRPETTIEDEVGLELRFFDGRLHTDVAAYRKSSYDQIFSVPSSSVTGFTSITRNAGDLRNKGIELTMRGTPLEVGRLSWNAGVNWSKNWSEVLRLAPGVTSISLAGYSWPQIRIMEGQPYGVIWGYGWKRNCVAADACFKDVPVGTRLIGNDGYPMRSDDQRNLGSVMPDWIVSFTSELRFGAVGLSGLVDVRQGGRIINFETQYEVNNGRSILTNDRYTWTVEEGVNVNTGQKNTVRLFKDQDYYPLIYGFDRHENQIEPADFVKFRELSLSYRVPARFAQRAGFQTATMYVTGRNLATWSKFSSGDPEGDVYQGTNAGGQYFRQFPEPQTRSLLMGVRTSF